MRAEQEIEPRTTSSPDVKKDTMFVALGKDVKESEPVLLWALRNSRRMMRICVLHVHQPAQKIALMGGKVSISLMEERLVKAHHDIDRQEMQKTLDKYIQICDLAGVRAEKLHIELDSIEKGIVQLISEHGIKWLVMGAATKKLYSRKMKEPKLKKALHVQKEAPNFCHIWFICKGNLIHTRESKIDGSNTEAKIPPIQAEGVNGQKSHHRTQSDIPGLRLLAPNTEGDSDYDSLSNSSPSVGSHFSARSCSQLEDSTLSPFQATEENGMGPETPVASDAIAKASKTMYAEEVKHMRESEEALARCYEEVDNMKMQLTEIMQELRTAQEHKSSLESQILGSDKMVDDLEQKMFSAVELLKKYKMERDKLLIRRDNALREAEGMREKQAEEASSSSASPFFLEFSFSEIERATDNFSQDLKIAEGGYGRIYRGNLRHTQVAIKVLHPNSSQGPFEFQHEVNILSELRHQNIITLIGACPEAWAIIYEYLSNGSLEDRLNCKDNTPPLPWKTRLCIASDLCSALVFLHSRCPQGIIHGDLKPTNILLDANFVTKLGDIGICRKIRKRDNYSENDITLLHKTDQEGTLMYMDPEFLVTRELTPKSNVYSLGIILLRLLTGRSALGLIKEVQYALDQGSLKDLLDPTAGDWPFVQAKQLAHLGLSCADMSHRGRPDLGCEVQRVLENMKVSCGVLGFGFGGEGRNQTPAYFVCPIFQEIMQDPVTAADGFTYESEALKGWLESQDTSPMTNLKLPHRDFVPNHALRSAIQEWLHKS